MTCRRSRSARSITSSCCTRTSRASPWTSMPWPISTTCGRSRPAGRYLLLQLSIAVPTLLGVVTLVFLLVRVIPGDPAAVILGDGATPAALPRLHEALRLDQPLPVQYARF